MTINKREIQAIISTLIFWLIMMTVGVVVVSMQPDKTEYKTISIQLDSPVLAAKPKETPVEKIEQVEQPKSVKTEPVTQPNVVETKPVAPAKEVVTKSTTPVKTEPVASTKSAESEPIAKINPSQTVQPTPAPQKLQKSVEELMAEQNAANSTKTTDDVDWDSIFNDSKTIATSSEYTETQSSTALSGSEALSGSVASASTDVKGSATSSNNRADTSISESTSSALNAIGKASFSDSGTGSGLTSTVSVVSDSASSNGTVIQMIDGSMRKLLDPLKPVLTISPENEKLIDSSRLVTITFTVKAEGNVLPTSIDFTPSGLLPLAVKSDLRIQIAKWRFEKALGDGQAEFKYSINKQ